MSLLQQCYALTCYTVICFFSFFYCVYARNVLLCMYAYVVIANIIGE